MTILDALEAELYRLEVKLDDSERKVEGALFASTCAALIGTLSILLGVGLTLYLAL